jgi:hypothetical protein
MIIYVDYNLIHRNRKPLEERIRKLNHLKSQGHEIHVWISSTDVLLHVVIKELQKWGCQFTYIKIGRPNYDLLIDDKTEKGKSFFSD